MGFQYQLSLNAGQKYCRMLQGEHSAILSTYIKLSFSIMTLVLSILCGRLRHVQLLLSTFCLIPSSKSIFCICEKRRLWLNPYLTGLRLFCDSWRQTSRVGRKAVSKQSPVFRNFLACVAKWRKVVAKILNMFKNFMRQNTSQIGRKVIAVVSNPSRTCRRPLAIQSQSFWNRTYLRDK